MVVALVPVVFADQFLERTPSRVGPTAQVPVAAAAAVARDANAAATAAADHKVAQDPSLQRHFRRRNRAK